MAERANRFQRRIDQLCNIGNCGGDGGRDECVLGIDDFQNAFGWKKVNVD
jgi:hypothetical protein